MLINKIYSLKTFSNLYGISVKKVQNLSVNFGLNPSNKHFKFKKKIFLLFLKNLMLLITIKI